MPLTGFLDRLLAERMDPVPSSLADFTGIPMPSMPTYTGTPVPMGGVPATGAGLGSFMGMTLQQPALQSLLQALQAYNYMPGAKEASLFGPEATFRTAAQQAALYQQKPGVAAPPGQSLHQQGLDTDLPAALQTQRFFDLLRSLGWYQLPSEPWHWSYGVLG